MPFRHTYPDKLLLLVLCTRSTCNKRAVRIGAVVLCLKGELLVTVAYSLLSHRDSHARDPRRGFVPG